MPPEGVGALLADAVRLRLRSDVPVGTSLSGGVDSSLVIALVRSASPQGELHAFTASFPGSDRDELPRAASVAERLDVTMHPVPLGADDLPPAIEPMHHSLETPIDSPSAFAQYRVMQAAADVGITVLLDGQGADETWGGKPKYAANSLTDELLTGRLSLAVRRERAWREAQGTWLRPAVSRYAALIGGPTSRRLVTEALRLGPTWLASDFRRAHAGDDPVGGVPLPAARIGHVGVASQFRDVDRVMLPRLLRSADRNSMAWSREVRLPYLDHRVAELALSLPLDQKLVAGWSKEPLRRLLEVRGLGDVARHQGKFAFMPPTDAWMATGELAERTASAWRDLHQVGLLARPSPVRKSLVRWRVLSLATWASGFSVGL